MKIDLDLFLEIQRRYSEPRRKYHNWQHIQYMLDLTHQMTLPLDCAQQAAIILHDIVYSPGCSGQNEFKSALFAYEAIKSKKIEANSDIVGLCILSTICEIPLCEQAKAVVDLDLAILGSVPEIYERYVAAIREEYSQTTPEQWIAGRSKFLSEMLNRDRIFFMDEFRYVFEDKARDNMAKELGSLN